MKNRQRPRGLAEVFIPARKTFETGHLAGDHSCAGLSSFPLSRRKMMPHFSAQSTFSYVDEYALASRLSYFLWSTSQIRFVRFGSTAWLRKNLAVRQKRMISDSPRNSASRILAGSGGKRATVDGMPSTPDRAGQGCRTEKHCVSEQARIPARLAQRKYCAQTRVGQTMRSRGPILSRERCDGPEATSH